MKKELIRVSTVGMTRDQWLAYRHSGVGGSEIGSIMGLNPYKASIALFEDKLRAPKETETNEAMWMGKNLEDLVAELWQYWDGDIKSTIKNHEEGKIQRRCKRVNAYLRHPDFEEIFISLDREINKTDTEDQGVLEVKTIAGFASKQWESGLPPYHLIQLQTYLLVTGYKKGEIAMLKDGRFLEVIPFEEHPSIQESIRKFARGFWERITGARAVLKEQFNLDYLPDQPTPEMIQAIERFEPPADKSESYKEFLQSRYKSEAIKKPGRTEHYRKALQLLDHRETIKSIEAEMNLFSSEIKKFMAEAEELDFGAGGMITWRTNKKGTRTFLIDGIKVDPSFKVEEKKPEEESAGEV